MKIKDMYLRDFKIQYYDFIIFQVRIKLKNITNFKANANLPFSGC